MDKTNTSDVEKSRLASEEPYTGFGPAVVPQQIWRYAKLIPSDPGTVYAVNDYTLPDGTGRTCRYGTYTVPFGSRNLVLLTYYEKFPLTRVPGTRNAWYGDKLSNIVMPQFGEKYQYRLFDASGGEYAFDIGEQTIDIVHGVLVFGNEAFIEEHADDTALYITFYRYSSETGFMGENSSESIPFIDDIPLVKSSKNDSVLAQFLARGAEGTTKYQFPAVGGVYVAPADIDTGAGVVVLQQNLNEILWNAGVMNGGVFIGSGTGTKAMY